MADPKPGRPPGLDWRDRLVDPLEGAKARLAPDPDSDYGTLWPVAAHRPGSASWVQHGANTRLALPASVRQAASGWLDVLGAARGRGEITPQAVQTLLSSLLGGGLLAPRGAVGSLGARLATPAGKPPAGAASASRWADFEKGVRPDGPAVHSFPVKFDKMARRPADGPEHRLESWRPGVEGGPDWRYVRDPLGKASEPRPAPSVGPGDKPVYLIVGKGGDGQFHPGWVEPESGRATLNYRPYKSEAEAEKAAARSAPTYTPPLTPSPAVPGSSAAETDSARLRRLMQPRAQEG